VDAGSYLSYGVGFVITSLSALVVLISGVITFQNDTQSESDVLGHFGQVEIAHTPELNMSGMDIQTGLPADNLPPRSDPGLTQSLQGYPPSPVFAGGQPNLQPIQVPQQPLYSKITDSHGSHLKTKAGLLQQPHRFHSSRPTIKPNHSPGSPRKIRAGIRCHQHPHLPDNFARLQPATPATLAS